MGAERDRAAPISVRLIHRAVDVLRHRRRTVLGIAAALAVALAFARGLYTVDNGETAAVLRLGALVGDSVAPGLHFRLPAGIERVTTKRTGEVYRVAVEEGPARELDLVTGDENLIEVALTVQYRVTRLGAFLFHVEEVESLLAQVVRAALVESVAGLRVDDVLTSAKALIQQQARHQAQRLLDTYGAGVTLVTVNLQSVDPPAEAAAAFREVLDARAQRAEAISRAHTEREAGLRRARGEAAQITHAAAADADRRVQAARGAAERFTRLAQQDRVSSGQTRIDLYTRTIRQVLPRARVIVLAPGETPDVDVNLLPRRGAPRSDLPWTEEHP